jgi:hypothetical protein
MKALEERITDAHKKSLSEGHTWRSLFMSESDRRALGRELESEGLIITKFRGLNIRIAETDHFYFGTTELD